MPALVLRCLPVLQEQAFHLEQGLLLQEPVLIAVQQMVFVCLLPAWKVVELVLC